jgi:hypothetical protein
MKNLMKIIAFIWLTGFAFNHIQAQEVASLSTGGYPEAKAVSDKPAAPVAEPGPVIHVTLKNNCGKTVRFFAGSKADLKAPNIQTCGGMSKNTFTLPSTDLICLMKEDNKPLSCAYLKPTTTICEINDTGNNISCK